MTGQVEVLEVGGIPIALASAYQITQTYTPIGGAFIHRLMTGSAIQHTHWRKLATTIQGQGAIPPGLTSLDYNHAMTIKCIASRGENDRSTTITVPVARRTDPPYQLMGCALVNNNWVDTTLVVNGATPHLAELAPVAGAQLYRVVYFPELITYAQPPTERIDQYTKEYNWTLEAVQI